MTPDRRSVDSGNRPDRPAVLSSPEGILDLIVATVHPQFVAESPPTDAEVPLLVDLAHALARAAGTGSTPVIGAVAASLPQGLLVVGGELAAAEHQRVVRLVELDPITGRALLVGKVMPPHLTLLWLANRTVPAAGALAYVNLPPAALRDLEPAVVSPEQFERPAQWAAQLPLLRQHRALQIGTQLLVWAEDLLTLRLLISS